MALVALTVVVKILLFAPVWALTRPKTAGRSAAMVVAETVGMGLAIFIGYLWNSSTLRDVFPLKPVRWSLVPSMALMLLGGILAALAVNFFLQLALPKPTSLRLPDGPFWGAFLIVVVVGPVGEELLFRGVILRGLVRSSGRLEAVLLSGLLFALFHANPWQFPVAYLLGAIFGWWVVETGSLLPGIVGHGLNNLVPLLLGMAAGNVPRHSLSATPQTLTAGLATGLVGFALLSVSVWLFDRQTKRHPEPE